MSSLSAPVDTETINARPQNNKEQQQIKNQGITHYCDCLFPGKKMFLLGGFSAQVNTKQKRIELQKNRGKSNGFCKVGTRDKRKIRDPLTEDEKK